MHVGVVVDDPDRLRTALPQGAGGESVGEQLVVGRRQGVEEELPARGQLADRVPLQRRGDRLVDRVPVLHPIAESVGDESRVVGEPVGGLAVEPSPVLLERRGEIPVIEGGERRHAGVEQRIHDPVVVVDARRVRGSRAGRLHAHPRDREPVPIDAEAREQIDVLLVAVEAVRARLGRGTVADGAGGLDEVVPDRAAASAFAARAFDLEGRGRCRPAQAAQGIVGNVIGHGRAPSLLETPRVDASDLPSSGSRVRTTAHRRGVAAEPDRLGV